MHMGSISDEQMKTGSISKERMQAGSISEERRQECFFYLCRTKARVF